ncbi:MAG: hypothetical protein AB7E13_11165 [Arcobacteraceae bacterium]
MKKIWVLWLEGKPIEIRTEKPEWCGYDEEEVAGWIVDAACSINSENMIPLGYFKSKEEAAKKAKREYGRWIPVEWTGPGYYIIWGAVDPSVASVTDWFTAFDSESEYYDESVADILSDIFYYVEYLREIRCISEKDEYRLLGMIRDFRESENYNDLDEIKDFISSFKDVVIDASDDNLPWIIDPTVNYHLIEKWVNYLS